MGPDIRYFDAKGTYLAKAGGRGQGPGEFQYIQDLLVLPGDTLLVLNFRNKVWLTADGKFVRQELMQLGPLSTNGWFSEGASFLPNGDLLAPQYKADDGSSAPTGLFRPPMRYSVLNLRSGTVTPVLTTGGLRQTTNRNGGGGVQPFSPHPQTARGLDRVYVGDNDTTIVSMFAFDGKPLGTITVASNATPVTPAMLAEYRRASLEMIGTNAERRERFERSWNEVAKPARLPYWGRLISDHAGNLWVGEMVPGRVSSMRWDVFDKSGRRLARVSLPGDFGPMDIGNDFILGVRRDESGVESIRMYSLARR